ncbi:MAG: hypothetical protein AB1810_15455 [Pseudomonadota bacterium]
MVIHEIRISRVLVVAPVVTLLLALLAVLSALAGDAKLSEANRVARLFDQGATQLQQVLRGLNEIILTEGTPQSIRITQQAIGGFDNVIDEALQTLNERDAKWKSLRANLDVWRQIKERFPPFFSENEVHMNDQAMMIEYGRLSVDVETLLGSLSEIAQQAEVDAQAKALRVKQNLVVIMVVCLLGIGMLFAYLYFGIAQPLHVLKKAVEYVTRPGGDLGERIATAAKSDIQGMPARYDSQSNHNEIAAFSRAFKVMARSIAQEMSERTRVEKELRREREEQHVLIERMKEAQQRILDHEQLAMAGQLASEVAREIKRPVGALKKDLQGLQADLALASERLQRLVAAEDAAAFRAHVDAMLVDAKINLDQVSKLIDDMEFIFRSGRNTRI